LKDIRKIGDYMKRIMNDNDAKKEIRKYTRKNIEETINGEFWVLSVYFVRKPNMDKYRHFFAYCDMYLTLENLTDRECDYNYRICFTESLKRDYVIVFNKIRE